MVRSSKGTDTAMTDGGGDSGTMIINATAENTMIRNDTAGLSTMTSALGTMVINEEESNNDTAKGLFSFCMSSLVSKVFIKFPETPFVPL